MESLRKRRQPLPRTDARPLPPSATKVSPLPAPRPRDEDVQVIFGASVQNLPLVGLSISEARELASTVLQADRRAPLLVNGSRVRRGYVIRPGDRLEFVHHAGEKGVGLGPAH